MSISLCILFLFPAATSSIEVDQTTQVAVAKELQAFLKKEDYDKVVDLMLPLKLAKSKGLLNESKLKKYAKELDGLAAKSKKYKKLLDGIGFSFTEGKFSHRKPFPHAYIKGIKVSGGIDYRHGKVKVREFIDRLYLIDGKWYIYQLVDDRHLKDEYMGN